MKNIDKQFRDKFQLEKLFITNVGHWVLSLRPLQPTLGSFVLTLNRKCDSLADLTKEESEDLGKSFNEIDKLLRKTFNPDKINYFALMMIDNQVHFHIIPRYEKERVFLSKSFSDSFWPKPPDVLKDIGLTDNEMLQLLEKFKS